MPTYSYKGIDGNGKKIKKIELARSENELYKRCKQDGICIFDVQETVKKNKEFHKLTTKELSEFSRQIGTMQNAGVPINKALVIIADGDIKPGLKKVYDYLAQAVTYGHTLSEAMMSCKNSFPRLMINMFRSGELGGRLGDAALKMEQYYDSEMKIKSKTQNAMAYPLILAVATTIMVLVLFTYVLPVFVEMYVDSEANLHWITSSLMTVSDFIIQHGIVLLLLVIVLLIIFIEFKKIPQVRFKIDEIKLAMPKIGKLLSIMYTSRFARTLSSLYSTGIPMLDAVEIAATTVGNTYIEAQLHAGNRRIHSGLPLSTALEGVSGMDKKLLASIYVGEESGTLEDMLISSSEQYEYEAGMSIDKLLVLLEPMMLIVMGLIIGPIMIGIMLPMFEMYTMY